MKRDEFLSKIGCPHAVRSEADAVDVEAQKLWDTIRNLYYTKAGKERKVQPDPWSDEAKTRSRSWNLRKEANVLRTFADRLDCIYADPWSHIRSEELREFGFDEAAKVVDAARLRMAEHNDKDRFVREAEAG